MIILYGLCLNKVRNHMKSYFPKHICFSQGSDMLITIPENPTRGYHHHPLNQTSSAPQRRSTDQSLRKTKIIGLQRSLNASYGFHLRGGREHGTGFFISHVDVGSEAYRKGLRVSLFVLY